MRLLLVEDHVPLVDELLISLKAAGYAVDWRVDGRDAQRLALLAPYDLIILDLGLPGRPGLEVLQSWRNEGVTAPVLVLTARSAWVERIDGLKAGADDYLCKPFHMEELLLRIAALLRRSHGRVGQAQLCVGNLQLDENRQSVLQNGREIELSSAEFRLLRYLMLRPGHLLSKPQLAAHLYDGESERDSNVIEVQINHLRRKLGSEVIETRRGQGYRLSTQPP